MSPGVRRWALLFACAGALGCGSSVSLGPRDGGDGPASTDGPDPGTRDGPGDSTADGPAPGPTFVRGYNFGGAGTETVTIDGHALLAQDVGGSASLRLTPVGGSLNAWATTIGPGEFVPAVDDALAKVLNHHVSVSGGGLQIEQGLTNGTYQVYTYHLENNAAPPRSFDVAVQGTVVTTSPVALAQYHWVKLGPYEAVVTDGVLEVALQHIAGDASIMGLEIYTTTGGQVQDLPAPPGPPGWTLVWSDEFDTPGLPDSSKWDYEEGYVRNNELQYYTRARPENARVENGALVIEARRDNFEGHEITAASLITKGKQHFLYGRVEVRAKLPTGLGTWPAIWTLGANIDAVGWPRCGEIDIMENVGFEPDRIYGTVHLTDDNGAHTSRGDSIDATAPYDTFHVYAIEWYADRIDFFLDDTKYFTFNRDEPGTVWPFDQEQYLLLNFAFGGSWGGQQGVDVNALPLQYYVDYVRIYEQAP